MLTARPPSVAVSSAPTAWLRSLAVPAALTVLLCLFSASDAPDSHRRAVGWQAVWSTTFRQDSAANLSDDVLSGSVAGVSEQVLALGLGRGNVVVLDVATGAVVSTVPAERGRGAARQIWIAGRTLVVRRGATPEDYGRETMLTAYDLPTGARLWATGTADDFVVTPRGVMLLRPSGMELLDVRRGTTTASVPVSAGCAVQAAAAAQAVAVLRICLGERMRLSAVDPATGRPHWERALPYEPPPGDRAKEGMRTNVMAASDGSVLAQVNQTSLLYAPDGQPLPVISSSVGEVAIAATDGVLAYTFTPAAARGMEFRTYTQAIDPVTRQVRWTRQTGPLTTPLADRRTFVAMNDSLRHSQESPWPLPAYLTALDAVTGEVGDLLLPTPNSGAMLVAMGGGMVFVLSPKGGDAEKAPAARLTAYRLIREERPRSAPMGAVPASSWPDACRLLTTRDLASRGGGHRAFPRIPDAARTAPAPEHAACDWIPPTDDGAIVSVSVDWTAPSTREARELFTAETDYWRTSKWARLPVASQDPAIFYYESGTPAGSNDHALVNVGPVIARLTLRSPANLPILAPRLRDNLRALYP